MLFAFLTNKNVLSTQTMIDAEAHLTPYQLPMYFTDNLVPNSFDQSLKYTYTILPLSNCLLSPGNEQLSKLHANKTHLYLRVQKQNSQCLSKCIIFWLRCIWSRRKSSYLSIPENNGTRPLRGLVSHYFSGMDRYSDFLLYFESRKRQCIYYVSF